MYVQQELFPREPISMILFLLGRGFLRGSPILIWSSSVNMINDKITEISNSYEQIIEIIMNRIKSFFYKIK